jgi:hypothetical protein
MSAIEHPDPFLSANIYCSGRLDELMERAIVPFWRDLGTRGLEQSCHLWTLRYGRRGEHLKLRFHGLESCRPLVQELLARAVDEYFGAIENASEDPPPASERWEMPPIDLEDQGTTRAGDRSLLWTTYQRSPISLGGGPLLSDDGYVSRLTRALACGFESALEIFGSEKGSPLKLRRNALLKMLVAALSVAGFPAAKRLDYLIYHRDWLLRVAIVNGGMDPAISGKLLDDLDRQAEKVGPGLAILNQVLEREWSGAGPESAQDLPWHLAVGELCEYTTLFRGKPGFDLDPFAKDVIFLPFFKVLHGLSNQMGLPRLEEAFSIHLLLCAAGASSDRSVRFLPD